MDHSGAARQRFGYASHQVKLLRAGEPEQPRLLGAVGGHLDVRQQLRRVLNLIYERRRGETLHEQRRVCLSQAQNERVVQSHVGAILPAEMSEEGGLPNLPCSSQQHDRELLCGPGHEGFECARDIHGVAPDAVRLICILAA